MKVLNLCCTYNRYNCLTRVLKCFLEQDYEGEQVLYIFNSGATLHLEELDLPANKQVILVNNNKNIATGEPYSSVGEKYIDAFLSAPSADIVTSFDDDDFFFSNFNRMGVEGLQKAMKDGHKAYKTMFSYFRHTGGIEKMNNVFEPSIFVQYDHIKEHLYNTNNVLYHQKWLQPLLDNNQIYVDPDAEPLFMYDWHPELRVYKMSGGKDEPSRFYAHQKGSTDIGPGVLKPMEDISKYYNIIPAS